MYEQRPWLRFYGVPESLDYPSLRLDEVVARSAERLPDRVAYHFLGRTATYRRLHEAIERCAAGLVAHRVRPGDRVTIALPTSPQDVVAFYAVSRAGVVSSMIHPLSTPEEIEHYLNLSHSRLAITLDGLYDRFAEVQRSTPLETIVVARISDEFPLLSERQAMTDHRLRARDGAMLFARVWAPDDVPKGVVCLVHGIGEHSGRYGHLWDALRGTWRQGSNQG